MCNIFISSLNLVLCSPITILAAFHLLLSKKINIIQLSNVNIPSSRLINY